MKELRDWISQILAIPHGWVVIAGLALCFLVLCVIVVATIVYVLVRQGRGFQLWKLKVDPQDRKNYVLEGTSGHSYSKLLYVKVIHFREKGNGKEPVYIRRMVEAGSPEIAVYDEAVYYSLHVFARPQKRFRWSIRSSGQVDPFIAHPWTERILYPDQKERLLKNLLTPTCQDKSNVYVAISHFYNGLQFNDQDVTLRVEEDIEHARLVVDFSSLPGLPLSFQESPRAFLITRDGEHPIGISESRPKVFVATHQGLKDGEAIKITFKAQLY